MMRITYIAIAAVILVALGIYASNAQNTNTNADNGTWVIETETVSIPTASNNGQQMNNTAENNNSENTRRQQNNSPAANNNMGVNGQNGTNNPSMNNTNTKQGEFEPLAGNAGVEVAPDNQPVANKAMKNQNPSYNNSNPTVGDIYEQEVIETVD